MKRTAPVHKLHARGRFPVRLLTCEFSSLTLYLQSTLTLSGSVAHLGWSLARITLGSVGVGSCCGQPWWSVSCLWHGEGS